MTSVHNEDMSALLPLFPLSLVLLPATPLPLHIFEDRYKEMISDIMPSRGEFGVVLVKDRGIVNVGCTATVDKVLQRYPDGKLDLLAIGQRRFRIVGLDDEKSYLRGQVEFFNDETAEEAPPELREQAIAGYLKLRDVQAPDIVVEPQLANPQVSFQLAQFIADLDKRQAMLALRSERERLEFLVSFLPEYTDNLKQTNLAKQLAPRNGHAKHVKDI